MSSSVLDRLIAAPAELARDPDCIHLTGVGVGADRPQAVRLHLHGRNMNTLHLDDVAAGTRREVARPHDES